MLGQYYFAAIYLALVVAEDPAYSRSGQEVMFTTFNGSSNDLLAHKLRPGDPSSEASTEDFHGIYRKRDGWRQGLLPAVTTIEEAPVRDVFQDIFHKANSLKGLFGSDSGLFLRHGITLSPDAERLVFRNGSSSDTQPLQTTADALSVTSSGGALRNKRRRLATTRHAKVSKAKRRAKRISLKQTQLPVSSSFIPDLPDVFRAILRKVNSLEGLFDNENGIFMTLSPEAEGLVLRNTSSFPNASSPPTTAGTTVPATPSRRTRKVADALESTLPATSAKTASRTTATTKLTSVSRIPKRVKLTGSHPISRQRSTRTTRHVGAALTKKGTGHIVHKTAVMTSSVHEFIWYTTHRSSYLATDKEKLIKTPHLKLRDGVIKKRFGNISNIEVQMMSVMSPNTLQIPDVDVSYKQAVVYKTVFQNSSVELFCLVAYKNAATILWRIDGYQPEEGITTEVVYAIRNGSKIIVSRLWLPRLEVLPSATGRYAFVCIAKADDLDAKSQIDITGVFNDSCLDDTDCEFKHAVCVFGKCECKDFMPVPLRSKHTTCRAVGFIDWPCHYDEQCAYAVRNSVCRAQRCVCKDKYRRALGVHSCVLKTGLGAECKSQSDCDSSRSLCKQGHCECPEGATAKEGTCFNRTSQPLLEMVKKRIFDASENDSFPSYGRGFVNASLRPPAVASNAYFFHTDPSGFAVKLLIAILLLMFCYA